MRLRSTLLVLLAASAVGCPASHIPDLDAGAILPLDAPAVDTPPARDAPPPIDAPPDAPPSPPDAPPPLDAPRPPCGGRTLSLHGTALGVDLAALEVTDGYVTEGCLGDEMHIHFRDPSVSPAPTFELTILYGFGLMRAVFSDHPTDGSDVESVSGPAVATGFERDGMRWLGVSSFTLDGTDAGGSIEMAICSYTCF